MVQWTMKQAMIFLNTQPEVCGVDENGHNRIRVDYQGRNNHAIMAEMLAHGWFVCTINTKSNAVGGAYVRFAQID